MGGNCTAHTVSYQIDRAYFSPSTVAWQVQLGEELVDLGDKQIRRMRNIHTMAGAIAPPNVIKPKHSHAALNKLGSDQRKIVHLTTKTMDENDQATTGGPFELVMGVARI
jgi:hypothetical protein